MNQSRILTGGKNCLLFMSIITLGLLISTGVFAADLLGHITDQVDQTEMVNAIITLSSPDPAVKSRSVVADENGNYMFTNVLPGQYSLKVSYVGYSTWFKRDIILNENEELMIDVSMIPTSVNLNAISVTASRRPEKLVDAPAAVSLVGNDEIEERSTLTPTEHVKGLPAVDVASTGLNQSNMVVRGFNNIFSGTLLVLTDNRIARVPSLRFNAYNFIPTVNEDVERIEIVSGPGSALYGPNSAAGVMHIISKSPFSSAGTDVSIGGGERDVVIGSFRHAGVVNENVAYKLSGQYYQGNDWEHNEPAEPDSITLFLPTSEGPNIISAKRDNKRDFDVEKIAMESRVDFHLNENTGIILNGGFNRNNSIELTGLGAGQAIDWTYYYGQARFTYKDLYIQGFVNASDAGDTYLLNTGQLIVDKSRLWVAQIQHRYAPTEKLSLTYGIDGLFTRPNTESTINGRNEDNDNINEIGGYVQADYQLNDYFKFVGAARLDDHNRLEDMVFSPRVGVVYQPDNNNNFRATYNTAYSTPDNNSLYLDLLSSKDPFGVGESFAPVFGFSPDIDIRVQGVPETGFHWNFDNSGNPYFRSSFGPIAGLTNEDMISYNDPLFTNTMWAIGSGAVQSGFADQMNALYQAGQVDSATAANMTAAVAGIAPATVSGVNNTLMTFNPDTRSFDATSISSLADIEPLKPTMTKTFELGYKGIIGDRLQLSVDVYRTEKDNFIGPLTIETPNVFLDPATLAPYLQGEITTNYANASPQEQAYLNQLDALQFGGNNNGTPIDELTAMYTSGAASIPFGTVTPEEMLNPDALLITYRNFGDVTYYGLDFGTAYHLNQNWNVGGTYSYVSKNFFAKNENQVHDIYLNAPRHKFGLFAKFNHQKSGFSSQARLRFVDGYDMNSPFFGSRVESFTVVDLNVAMDIIYSARLSLSIQNLFDNRHIEFVGAPEIGRLAILRLSSSF